MESKIEFALKPVTGAASSGGGFRAILKTAKGDAMDFDDVVTEALDRGYIAGVKDILAKSVVKGVLDSMIAGVLRDGITRRIGDYLSVSLKVHGRFENAQDEFDPASGRGNHLVRTHLFMIHFPLYSSLRRWYHLDEYPQKLKFCGQSSNMR